MNNFFLPSDPILNNYTVTANQNGYQNIPQYKNMDYNAMYQFQTPQNGQTAKDWINELDKTIKSLDGDLLERLSVNSEYIQLSNDFQNRVQEEIMNTIKNRLNNDTNVINNISRQIDIINSEKLKLSDEEKRNMNELNDYIKNYSNMTFDDYKKIKSEVKETAEKNNKKINKKSTTEQ